MLRWRRSDQKLGLPQLHSSKYDPEPNWDCEIQVSRIRDKKWLASATTLFLSPRKPIVRYVVPSKAARKRADEIIAVYDEWKPQEGKPPRGYKKALRERDKAHKIATRLEERLINARASTIDGMLAKIRCAHAQMEEAYELKELEGLQLEQISGCADEIAVSIFRDLQRLALTGSRCVVPTSSGAQVDDPIFAAIETHRTAYADFLNEPPRSPSM